MEEQLELELAHYPAALPSKHPVVVLRWQDDGVQASWPEFNIVSWFRDWSIALPLVLPELNQHVSVRVRA